ncbi:hypothetical protein [Paraburkholderia bannensis]|uniref:hypothetical protein n=1 Tax=Paraburkholderia bannensis TaxID=765414 RepID=UPI002AB100E2|nr:hypothetical protein [Paraburkholderia bannensis]
MVFSSVDSLQVFGNLSALIVARESIIAARRLSSLVTVTAGVSAFESKTLVKNSIACA